VTQLAPEPQTSVTFRHHSLSEPGAHGYRWTDARSFPIPVDHEPGVVVARGPSRPARKPATPGLPSGYPTACRHRVQELKWMVRPGSEP